MFSDLNTKIGALQTYNDADACDDHILHLQNNIYQVLSNGKGFMWQYDLLV